MQSTIAFSSSDLHALTRSLTSFYGVRGLDVGRILAAKKYKGTYFELFVLLCGITLLR